MLPWGSVSIPTLHWTSSLTPYLRSWWYRFPCLTQRVFCFGFFPVIQHVAQVQKEVRHWLCTPPLPCAACTTRLNHPLHLLLILIFWPSYSHKFTVDTFSSSPSWFMPSFLVTLGGMWMNYFLCLSDPFLTFRHLSLRPLPASDAGCISSSSPHLKS